MDVDGSGVDRVLDFDGAMDRLSVWKGRIDKLATDAKAMSDRLQELRVTALDENRLVGVVLDSSGALVDLRLHQRVQGMAPHVLAQTIMETVRLARGKLAGRSQQIIAETLGTESEAARAIAERVGQRLLEAEPPGEQGGR